MKIAQTNRLPIVTANVAYQYNRYAHSSISHCANKGLAFGVNVSVPLYTGNTHNSHIQETQAKYDEAKYQLLATEQKIKHAIHQAYSHYLTGIGRFI